MSRTGRLLAEYARRQKTPKRPLVRGWKAMTQRQRASRRRQMRKVLGLPTDRIERRTART